MAASAEDRAQTGVLVRPGECLYVFPRICSLLGWQSRHNLHRRTPRQFWTTDLTKIRPPLIYYYPNITALAKAPSYSAPYIARGTVQQPEDSEWIIFGDTILILSVKYSAVPLELPHYCCLAT